MDFRTVLSRISRTAFHWTTSAQGYNISLVPVNMLERVEVYKGVLPTRI
jgi:Na+-transporting NADH:ubiquinone oxidoreductase subunit NqrA